MKVHFMYENDELGETPRHCQLSQLMVRVNGGSSVTALSDRFREGTGMIAVNIKLLEGEV